MPTRDRNLLNALFDVSPMAVVVSDTDRRIKSVNKAFVDLFGYAAEDVAGKRSCMLYAHGGAFENAGFMRFNARAGVNRDSYRVTYNRRDGSTFSSDTVGTAVTDENGETVGHIAIIRDVTPEVEMHAEIVRQKERAETAARAKTEFLANVSHEIRTPLNGVVGMAQVLERTALDTDQQSYVDVIAKSSASLLEIINDVLDFTKIDAGAVEFEEIPFDVGELARDLGDVFRHRAEERGVRLNVEVAPEAAGVYKGDPTKLRQVIANFASNAVKFTPAGGLVEIAVERAGAQAGGADLLTFSVRDTGLGLSRRDVARMFEPFTQADASTTRKFGGTGLGLTIARRIVEGLGGKIAVDSAPGEGSRFYFTVALPRLEKEGRAVDEAADKEARDPVRGLSLLVAEDNETNRLVMRAMIGERVAALDFAEDGRSAVDAWRQGGYDAILMDIQMPVMDGTAAVREIRSIEARERLPRTPVIAVSANAYDEQVESYLAAGMDGHVAKPVNLATLEKELTALAQRRAA
ncbi:MAG: ATP-binding protein [Pseudomonadota bacterium]